MAVAEILSIEDEFEVLRDVDLASVDAECLASMVLGLQPLQNWVEGRAALWLAEFAQRGQWAADGSRSLAAWVEERSHAPAPRIASQAKLGRALRSMPATRAAALTGELSQSHLRLLASCRSDATAELFDGDEAQLVEWAKSMRLREFKQVVRVWAAHADPDDVTVGEPDLVKVGQLFLSESLNGCSILKGTLDPEQGRLVAAAVDAELGRLLRAKRDGDPTHAERLVSEIRADALVNVVTQTMRKEPSERSVPDRYRVALVVNHEEDPDRVELCDCALYRVVKDTHGAVLDVSHATRSWPDAIRLAVTIRDQHCVFPGCDRPPSWCDVHHCQHWEHDGPTSINNGALLCRHHHTFIHKAKWSVNIKPGDKPTVHKPDGTTHQIVKYQIKANRTIHIDRRIRSNLARLPADLGSARASSKS